MSVEGAEECDDGNNVSGDGCSSVCLNEFCGDGQTQAPAGEQCDDGNNVSNDGCSSTCQLETVCGNGVIEGVETCMMPTRTMATGVRALVPSKSAVTGFVSQDLASSVTMATPSVGMVVVPSARPRSGAATEPSIKSAKSAMMAPTFPATVVAQPVRPRSAAMESRNLVLGSSVMMATTKTATAVREIVCCPSAATSSPIPAKPAISVPAMPTFRP